ncbi:c-type cytochrome [Ostreiculturibacter nitratireducens]|uniref:c-type cytochrome n=1 Tax=Ostreiculturibacter nitratireducens TaxID=3075226 RepID=UPI0031B5EE98
MHMFKGISIAVLVAGGIAALASCTRPEVSGRADYLTFCASCHGPSGKGDGEAAELLGKRPADLTTISARNGGTFPRVRVMSVIDGYTRVDQHGSRMPEFGPLLEEGDLILVETGDGIMTPTPRRLVALAAYLETIQE